MRFLIVVLGAGLLGPDACGQAAPASEYQAKAAFLYNFTKFVEWPVQAFPGPNAPLNLCVIGEETFGPALDAIQDRQSQGHPLVVRRLNAISQAGSCHILFIGISEEKQATRWLAALRGQAVLTVGDMDRFAENGGVINLVIVDQRVKMEVNLEAAQRQGLKISSQLLRLARLVGGAQ